MRPGAKIGRALAKARGAAGVLDRYTRTHEPVVEVNGYHVLDEGDVVTAFSGGDVLNLGGNQNENTITAAIGAEVRPCREFAVRAAYEFPLQDDHDLFGHRWTFSAVLKF